MAIDSFAKRASATHFLVNSFTPVVVPDGTIGQGDRQASALTYSGILAGGAAPATRKNHVGFMENISTFMNR